MSEDAWLQCRPRRLLEWKLDDQGRAVLLRPKLGRNRWARWLASRLKNPHYHIRLDEMGTLVWKSCNGERALSDIALSLRAQFGESIEPAEDRLVAFVRTLYRSRLVELARPR